MTARARPAARPIPEQVIGTPAGVPIRQHRFASPQENLA
jgi:hypothetical protein